MRRILVTGPIGSGKSAACGYLREKGYPVFDCDSECKALYDSVPGLKEKIEETLETDFDNLGIIFTDNIRREKLEALVYPILKERIFGWYAVQNSEVAFMESAIALQKPSMSDCYDEVLLVSAPYEMRLKRNPKVAGRDDLQSFDLSRAGTVITNDGSLEKLHTNIDNYLKTI